jgi:hypothetical protein
MLVTKPSDFGADAQSKYRCRDLEDPPPSKRRRSVNLFQGGYSSKPGAQIHLAELYVAIHRDIACEGDDDVSTGRTPWGQSQGRGQARKEVEGVLDVIGRRVGAELDKRG